MFFLMYLNFQDFANMTLYVFYYFAPHAVKTVLGKTAMGKIVLGVTLL